MLENFDTDRVWRTARIRFTVDCASRGDGDRVWATPVTIDNTEPRVVISEPKPDRLYVKEDDEQININVLPSDDYRHRTRLPSMSMIQPYHHQHRCTVQCSVGPYRDARHRPDRDGPGHSNWLGFESDDPEIKPGRVRPFEDGFSAVRTSDGLYLEGHTIKAVVYDLAGNEVESDEVVGLCA
jgi:hypothetical protein